MKKYIYLIFVIPLLLYSSCTIFNTSNKFTITYYDNDEVIYVKEYKDNIVPKEYSYYKEGYNFLYWTTSDGTKYNFDSVLTSDISLYANFEKVIKYYNVKYVDYYGNIIKVEKVEEGKNATPPTLDEVTGYKFIGWDGITSNINSDRVINSKYEILSLNITYIGPEDEVLFVDKVNYGESMNAFIPDVYGYTFIKWDRSVKSVKNDLTIIGEFEKNHYNVNFYNANNELIDSQKVLYKDNVIPPLNNEVYGYTFESWDHDLSIVTKDIDVYGIYTRNKYNVTFTSFDGVIYTTSLLYLDTIVYPDITVPKGYLFKKWDKTIQVIEEDIVISAVFEKIEYDVTFYDFDNNVITTKRVKYQESVSAPLPKKVKGYTFTGWDTSLNNITNNLEVHPVYSINNYTVTFIGFNNQIIKKDVLPFASIISYPDAPSINMYEFVQYDKDIKFIEEDIIINAIYKKIVFTIDFYGFNNELVQSSIVKLNEPIIYPSLKEVEGYDFIKWDKQIDIASSDEDIFAIYEKKEYTITLYDINNNILSIHKVKHGESLIGQYHKEEDGYRFDGWDKPLTNIKSDQHVFPRYTKAIDKDINITYDFNGGTDDYLNKDEYVMAFLVDFYEFVKPIETLDEFIYGDDMNLYDGTWKGYLAGNYGTNNKFLVNNNFNEKNEAYFINSSKYHDKWLPLVKWVNAFNNRLGGTSYQYGTLDLVRYINSDPGGWESVYGDNLYKYPKSKVILPSSFNPSKGNIVLPTLLSPKFLGWYLNKEGTGPKIEVLSASISSDTTLYASWDTEVTYKLMFDTNGGNSINYQNVHFGDEIILPTPSKPKAKFLGWSINGEVYKGEFTFKYNSNIVLKALWEDTLINLVYSSGTVKYRGSSTAVQIPSSYIGKTEEFRGVWISSMISDFTPSTNKEVMKQNLTKVLDKMEEYNLNVALFHLRTHNNALYKTRLAPIHNSYGSYETFEQWDYLPWLIEECHKRGIDFHAWLNPYRIQSSGSIKTAEGIAETYKNYPLNPASKKENIMVNESNGAAILNPGIEEVRNYIVDVCLELMNNYDIDGIHFDDYFYISMDKSILEQCDQSTFINNPMGFNTSSQTGKENWRRENVNMFIKQLHEEMTKFNKANNKSIELGISPTGIYANGSGKVSYDEKGNAITNGSNTAGLSHYSSYLFCDTKKWIDNEWIDYILPQSYWAFTHKVAGYADVVDWWAKVVKYKNVNLYTGMGIYMSLNDNTYSWNTEPLEAANQVLYNTKYDEIKGTCIFSFKQIALCEKNSIQAESLRKIKNEYWTNKVKLPKTNADRL